MNVPSDSDLMIQAIFVIIIKPNCDTGIHLHFTIPSQLIH